MCACVRACVRACLRVCVCACVRQVMACPSGCSNGGGQIKPHKISHVNSLYAQAIQPPLRVGTVLTEEPGMYLPSASRRDQEAQQEVQRLRAILQGNTGAGAKGHPTDARPDAEGASRGRGGEREGHESARSSDLHAPLAPVRTEALHTTFRVRELSLDAQLLEW